MVRWTFVRGLLAALAVLCSVPLSLGLSASFGDLSASAQSAVIRSIVVEGNRRVEPETVRSYLTFSSGDTYDPAEVNQSLKTLFATGLFQDVRIRRQGSTIIVVVVENPIVSRVAFEGNREIEDDTLASEVQLKSRAVYTRARVQADVQRILALYRRQGLYAAQVNPKIINLDNNRIDVVFEITEGPTTKVRAINFIGNQAFSDSQLRFVITTTRTNLLSFLKSTNIYDPDRLNLDRELLRQFYMKNGYADARVVSATADLDRDGRGFFITFTIEEGSEIPLRLYRHRKCLAIAERRCLARGDPDQARTALQRRESREDGRGVDRQGVRAGLCVWAGSAAFRARPVHSHDEHRLRHR